MEDKQHGKVFQSAALATEKLAEAFSRASNAITLLVSSSKKLQDALRLGKRKELYQRRYNRRAPNNASTGQVATSGNPSEG